MGHPDRKKKAVFSAAPEQLERIQRLVEAGRYRTTSDFLREAIDEKLEAIRHDLIAEQVSRYCEAGHADEDSGLIDHQAYDEES